MTFVSAWNVFGSLLNSPICFFSSTSSFFLSALPSARLSLASSPASFSASATDLPSFFSSSSAFAYAASDLRMFSAVILPSSPR